MNNAFLEIVTERKDDSLKMDTLYCPHCKSKYIEEIGHNQTLVGVSKGYDPNHHWRYHICNDCNKQFTVEHRDQNFWIVNNNEILMGIPTCHEDYVYHCSQCDSGKVRRRYTELDGESEVRILSYAGNGYRYFRVFFECDGCGAKVESINEYYQDNEGWSPPEVAEDSDPKTLGLGWTCKEEIGPVVICDNIQSGLFKE